MDVDVDDPRIPRVDRAYRRSIRNRLLILYIINILMLACLFFYLGRQDTDIREQAKEFRAAVITNCEANLRNTQTLNKTMKQLSASAASSPTLSDREKAERIFLYKQLTQVEPECPPK